MQGSPKLRSERIGGLVWTLRTDRPPSWWRDVLADPEAWLREPAMHFKNSRNVTLARIPSPDRGQPNIVLRRLNYGRWQHRLRDCFRPSRAQRALRTTLALESAGLPVPFALAAADCRWMRWPARAYVLTTEIVGARTLAEVIRRSLPLSRETVRDLAVVIAHLHQAGFTHGDLKATNVLIDPKGKPWLIDFDGVRRTGRVSQVRAVKNLARLAAGVSESQGTLTLAVAARFLKVYCTERGIGDWRVWHRLVRDHRQQGASVPSGRACQLPTR